MGTFVVAGMVGLAMRYSSKQQACSPPGAQPSNASINKQLESLEQQPEDNSRETTTEEPPQSVGNIEPVAAEEPPAVRSASNVKIELPKF